VPFSESRRTVTRRPVILLFVVAIVAGVLGTGVAGAQPANLGALEDRLAELNDQSDVAVEDYLEAKLELKKADQALAALRDRSSKAQGTLNRYRGSLGRRAAYAYVYGPGINLDAFLDTDDPDAALERVQMLSLLAQRDTSLMEGVLANQSGVAKLLAEADQARKAQARKVAQLEAKKAEIEKKAAETRKVLARLRAERRARNLPDPDAAPAGGSRSTSPSTTPSAPAVSGKAGVAVKFAYAQLGKPYQYGADGPGSYDCSGLTMAAWGAAGVSLPHSSRMQYSVTRRVSKASLAPGDLVFRGYNGSISHVSLYIGDGKAIYAPQTGDVVKIGSAFTDRDLGYGRVVG
jgi:cell wall-associated NlpC family hydrolase